MTYTYDGDGKRVKKSNGTLYWYGAGSDALMETDLSNNEQYAYIFFNGRRIARVSPSNEVNWFFTDHLGTSRVVWTLAGKDESDFYPFGGERVVQSAAGNRYKFTGKERDSESGLDNFGARYDSSTIGRFMSPDWALKPTTVPYADFGNPQSFNLYAYAHNNPLTYRDQNGHCIWDGCIVEIVAGAAIVYGLYRLYKGMSNLNDTNQKLLDQGGNDTFRCMDSNAICTNSEMRGVHDKRTETIKNMGKEDLKNLPDGAPAITVKGLIVDEAKDKLIDAMVDAAAKQKEQEEEKQEEENKKKEKRGTEAEKLKAEEQRKMCAENKSSCRATSLSDFDKPN